jgi:hypothetical protein
MVHKYGMAKALLRSATEMMDAVLLRWLFATSDAFERLHTCILYSLSSKAEMNHKNTSMNIVLIGKIAIAG